MKICNKQLKKKKNYYSINKIKKINKKFIIIKTPNSNKIVLIDFI